MGDLQSRPAAGGDSLIMYSTVRGQISAWDLRSNRIAWVLKNDPALGMAGELQARRVVCQGDDSWYSYFVGNDGSAKQRQVLALCT